MPPLDLEPEIEEYLARLVPGLTQEWQGASESEIARIEEIAGRPLPRFYRWFLLRMGVSMGSIAYPLTDFTAATVLNCYEEELVVPHPRFFMIGYDSDELMPFHVFYDFDHVVRDDARVARRQSGAGPIHNQFETMREMIAWGECGSRRIEMLPQRCVGVFGDVEGNVLAHLDPVMKSLGFETPIPTGAHCAVYEGHGAAMISKCTPDEPPRFHVFRLAAGDSVAIRRILGEIGTETPLEVKIREWDPPLA